MKLKNGFTLMELLIVIVIGISAILGSAAVVAACIVGWHFLQKIW